MGNKCFDHIPVQTKSNVTNNNSLISKIILNPTVFKGHRLVLCDTLDVTRFIEMILMFSSNLILFCFLISNRKLRGNKTNKYFINLQVVHLILSISGAMCILLPKDFPEEEIILNNGLLIEMFFSLIMTTGDRYMAIGYPYFYQTITTRRAIQVIVSSWIIPILFTGVALYCGIRDKRMTIVSTIIIAMATIVLTVSNLKVYMIAKKTAKTLTKNKNTKILKSTWVCFVLVSSFIVLWFPYFIHNILTISGVYEADSNKTATRILVQVAFLNSVLDPIFFVLFRKDVKKEVQTIYNRHQHARQFSAVRKQSIPNRINGEK